MEGQDRTRISGQSIGSVESESVSGLHRSLGLRSSEALLTENCMLIERRQCSIRSMWVLPRTVLAVSVLSGCRPEAPTRDSAEVALGGPATSLVVLVLDGLRVEESFGEGSSSINGAPTDSFLPQLRERYLDQGLRATAAANIGVTITTEAHVELLTGRRQSLATFERGTTETYRSDVPTLFELVRKDRGLSRSQTALEGRGDLQVPQVPLSRRSRSAPRVSHNAASWRLGRRGRH